MLQGTICNDDFQRNTALRHCCDFVPHGCNTVPTLQRCVALKIVVVSWNIAFIEIRLGMFTVSIKRVKLGNRELKQVRRRPQGQLQKTIDFISKTTVLHVHHAFQYISLTATARLRRETSKCDVLWPRTRKYDDEFSFLFLNLDNILKNSTPCRKGRLHLT